MKIQDLFLKPVDRPIDGVIKADDRRKLQTELEEYVFTRDVLKGLNGFTERYLNDLTANGVWISGFFGSGKSHLLKMLSLLLEGAPLPNGERPADILLPKLKDEGEVLILPHGVLNLVPFAALPLDSSGEPLGLRYALRYAPSLATLEEADARPGMGSGATRAQALRSALVVGNPSMPPISMCGVEGFLPAPLAWADSSSRHVAALLGVERLTGGAASEAEVRRRIAGARIVYLATHGYAYSTDAEARQSFVALAPSAAAGGRAGGGAAGGAGDGRLTVGEILDELPDLSADLVVLSACQTGLGDLKQAEGTVGLQRAFLARNARSVLVSLWNVDDRASAVLTDSFFRHWLEGSGMSKAEALRLAQREVHDAGWSEPRYWAAFQLAGAR